jgi:hypothetical protein
MKLVLTYRKYGLFRISKNIFFIPVQRRKYVGSSPKFKIRQLSTHTVRPRCALKTWRRKRLSHLIHDENDDCTYFKPLVLVPVCVIGPRFLSVLMRNNTRYKRTAEMRFLRHVAGYTRRDGISSLTLLFAASYRYLV